MKIECTFPEIDNIVVLNGVKYHFRRDGDDRSQPMVAEVGDQSHAAEILGMPGFQAAELVSADDDGDDDSNDEAPPAGLADKTFDELRDLYRERFGKPAHPNMKHETLLAKLAEPSGS